MSPSNVDKIKKSVGDLAARILIDALSGVPGLKEAVARSEALGRLSKGDISKETITEIATFVQGIEPGYAMLDSIRGYLTAGKARDAKALIDKGDYTGLIGYLLHEAGSEGLNPLAIDVKEAARRLVGAPIIRIYSAGRAEGGVITSTGAYTGDENDSEHFGEKVLTSQLPGTIGVWNGDGRGSYNVACIAAHKPREKGYVAIWAASLGKEQVGMKETTKRLGIEELAGTSVFDDKSPLIVIPHDDIRRKLTDNTKIAAVSTDKKGPDCVAGYRLVES